MTFPGIPDVLARVSERLGPGAALGLAHDFGGGEIYIPRRIRHGHPLVVSLGVKGAEALAEMFGSGELLIPLGPVSHHRQRVRAIVKSVSDGRTVAATVRATSVHELTVYRYRARLRHIQPDLFSR